MIQVTGSRKKTVKTIVNMAEVSHVYENPDFTGAYIILKLEKQDFDSLHFFDDFFPDFLLILHAKEGIKISKMIINTSVIAEIGILQTTD